MKTRQARTAPPGMTLHMTPKAKDTLATGTPKVTTVKHMEISMKMIATLEIKHAAHANERRTARVMMPNLGLSKKAALKMFKDVPCVTDRATNYNTKLYEQLESKCF